MIWIGSVIAALVICGAAFFVGMAISSESEPGSVGKLRGLLIRVGAIVLLVLWIGIHTASVSIKQVDAGHVGVVKQFGEIVDQKGEGLQFILPWQEMSTASIQVQRTQFDQVSAFSAQTQDVFLTVTLNYSVNPEDIQELFRDVGPNWFDRLVPTRLHNLIKEETVKFDTVDIAPNREELRQAVREALQDDLEQFSIKIDNLLIDNIDFQPEFKSAIEQKQIATQDALREEERIAQKINEAQQVIETARGEAESVVIAAEAQAEANRLLAESLTDRVIQFQALQKLAPNIQIALLPAGEGLIIDPATLLGDLTGP
ncbi:MAG TPA: prohibitin family protein [Dehalococcoidia bacterium]|nr:prohibitin family protein [Dehalococcoidia bacterium]